MARRCEGTTRCGPPTATQPDLGRYHQLRGVICDVPRARPRSTAHCRVSCGARRACSALGDTPTRGDWAARRFCVRPELLGPLVGVKRGAVVVLSRDDPGRSAESSWVGGHLVYDVADHSRSSRAGTRPALLVRSVSRRGIRWWSESGAFTFEQTRAGAAIVTHIAYVLRCRTVHRIPLFWLYVPRWACKGSIWAQFTCCQT